MEKDLWKRVGVGFLGLSLTVGLGAPLVTTATAVALGQTQTQQTQQPSQTHQNQQPVTVTFRNYDGTVIETKQTYPSAGLADMPRLPARPGYKPLGWFKGKIENGTVVYSTEEIKAFVAGQSYFTDFTQDTDVFAKYEQLQQTVTYKKPDGSLIGSESVGYGTKANFSITVSGSSTPITNEMACDAGKSIKGWKKGAATFGKATLVEEDLELTAECVNDYIVTYKNPSGAVIATEAVSPGGKITGMVLKGQAIVDVSTDSVACGNGKFKHWNRPDGSAFDPQDTISGSFALTAVCDIPVKPGAGYNPGWQRELDFTVKPSPVKLVKPAPVKAVPQAPLAAKPQAAFASALSKGAKAFASKTEVPQVSQVAGVNRVDTSLQFFSAMPNRSVAVIATGKNYPDGLTGSVLAATLKTGVVLTNAASGLENQILATFKANGTKKVYVVGGAQSVSEAGLAALRKTGIQVVRFAGADRYETSALVDLEVQKLSGSSAQVLLASGTNFPDALAAGAAAGRSGGRLLLVNQKRPAGVKGICVGGPACAASGQQGIVGKDRYDTAFRLASLLPYSGDVVAVTGNDFADALSAGAYAAVSGKTLLLSDGKRVNLPKEVKQLTTVGPVPGTVATYN